MMFTEKSTLQCLTEANGFVRRRTGEKFHESGVVWGAITIHEPEPLCCQKTGDRRAAIICEAGFWDLRSPLCKMAPHVMPRNP